MEHLLAASALVFTIVLLSSIIRHFATYQSRKQECLRKCRNNFLREGVIPEPDYTESDYRESLEDERLYNK